MLLDVFFCGIVFRVLFLPAASSHAAHLYVRADCCLYSTAGIHCLVPLHPTSVRRLGTLRCLSTSSRALLVVSRRAVSGHPRVGSSGNTSISCSEASALRSWCTFVKYSLQAPVGAERSVAGLLKYLVSPVFLFSCVFCSRAFLACPLSVGVALFFGAWCRDATVASISLCLI